MTEISVGTRAGPLLPPALTRTAMSPVPWTGGLMPPFVAGRTLPRSQAGTGDDGLVFDELELDDVAFDDVAFDDVAVDDDAHGDVAFLVNADRDETEPSGDDAIEEAVGWEPDVWPGAEWTAEDTSLVQPASEAAAFEAWSGSDEAEPVVEPVGGEVDDAPDEVARLLADRLDELAEQVRTRGLAGLGNPQDPDALSRLIAALVAGYVGRSD